MSTYTAKVSRDEGWWVVTVAEVPGLFTQVKRLEQVEPMVRDALGLFPEVESNPAEAVVNVEVQGTIGRLATDVQQVRAEADQAQTAASQITREAARSLAGQGLPYRDIGKLLGVSFQRAQKLVSKS